MKRGVVDVLRRGLDNTLANWPLILIRLAETIVFVAMAFAAIVAIVLPVIGTIGVSTATLQSPEALEELLTDWRKLGLLLLYVLGVTLFVLLAAMLLHSFVEAGSARVYVDGERLAGPELTGPRSRYRVFSVERWIAGGKDGWWTVFWMYNIAWGLAGLILLVPLLPTFVLMLVFGEAPEAAAVTGCLGMVVTMMLMFVVSIVVGIWTNRAIATWAVRRGGARDTLSAAWAAVRPDLGRHILVALAIFVVSMAGSSFFGSFSFIAAFAGSVGRSGLAQLFTLPIRMLASLASTAFGAAMAAWFLASFVGMSTESER